MTRTIKKHVITRCGNVKCNTPVEEEGILCDTCGLWYHPQCGRLKKKGYDLYIKHEILEWVCHQCKELIRNQCKLRKNESTSQATGRVLSLTPYVCTSPITKKVESGIKAGKVSSSTKDETKALVGTNKKALEKKATNHSTSGNSLRERTESERNNGNMTIDEEHLVESSLVQDLEIPDTVKIEHFPPEIVAQLYDFEKRISDLDKRLEETCNDNRSLKLMINKLEEQSDLALARNRKVVVYGIPEPHLKLPDQRDRALRHHVTNILRLANIQEYVPIKRYFRLGAWKNGKCNNNPRPVLVEFSFARHRDSLLTASSLLRDKSSGKITVKPDLMKANLLNGKMDGAGLTNPIIRVEQVECSASEGENKAHDKNSTAQAQVPTSPIKAKNGEVPRV